MSEFQSYEASLLEVLFEIKQELVEIKEQMNKEKVATELFGNLDSIVRINKS